MAVPIIDQSTATPTGPGKSKLETFGTAMGILMQLGGLGAQAASAFSPTAPNTSQMLKSGYQPMPAQYNLGVQPFADKNLTQGLGSLQNTYNNNPFDEMALRKAWFNSASNNMPKAPILKEISRGY